MEMVVMCSSVLLFLVGALISMAFVTLMEQKVLGAIQIRLGPDNVGVGGLLQPFADAAKLLKKESMVLRGGANGLYMSMPVISLLLSLFMWSLFPSFSLGELSNFSVVLFLIVSGLMAYPVILMGWSSNSKYSMLGSLRACAQTISYEISLFIILLSMVWVCGSFSVKHICTSGLTAGNLFCLFPIFGLWVISCLAETNRSPYDFAEGESELVSGFNTEYSSGGFTLIFMSEYLSILFMSGLSFILFFNTFMTWFSFLGVLLMVWIFVWVRGSLPRFRYDLLMNTAWKVFLPCSLTALIFFYTLSVQM